MFQTASFLVFPAKKRASAALCVGHGGACRVPSSDRGPKVALWVTWTPPCAGGPCGVKSGGAAESVSTDQLPWRGVQVVSSTPALH